tara:strand:+ start:312 stop:1652 length:1341 start_codon:yes stop_codon:yes gene_type:complete
MSSVFTTIPNKTIKGFAGKEYSVPFYIQFVPGIVVDVVHSAESLRYRGPNTINSIIAKAHITDKSYNNRSSLGEDSRYLPLFRGITDSPTKGDPVLLCTIGKINYYLGPLNTDNNPTFNRDPNDRGEHIPNSIRSNPPISENVQDGETLNKEEIYSRMGKVKKEGLDYGPYIRETTGDMLLEGRHGNSLRMGSRSNNPYLFISNKRYLANIFESLGDGSLISITSNGSLKQHFGSFVDENNKTEIDFKLASDRLSSPLNTIGNVWSNINGESEADDIYLYGAEKVEATDLNEAGLDGVNANQILFHSDRITLNTKLDDIFISSIKDIHVGAGRHLTFTTSGGPDVNNTDSVIFQTSNLNIGNPNNKKMQPMVLGKALQDVLVEIVNMLGKLQVVTSLGVQTPLTLGKFAGDVTPGQDTVLTAITNLETKIENILSTKHSIEENTSN